MKGLNFELQCQHKCCCNCDCNQLQCQCWELPTMSDTTFWKRIIESDFDVFFVWECEKTSTIGSHKKKQFQKQVLFIKMWTFPQFGFRHFWPIPALQLHLRICCNCISNWRAVNIAKTFFLQYSFIAACFDLFFKTWMQLQWTVSFTVATVAITSFFFANSGLAITATNNLACTSNVIAIASVFVSYSLNYDRHICFFTFGFQKMWSAIIATNNLICDHSRSLLPLLPLPLSSSLPHTHIFPHPTLVGWTFRRLGAMLVH